MMNLKRMIQACESADADLVPAKGLPSPFTPQQEEALLDIGGERLLKLARVRVAMMKHVPPVQFPTKERLEKERVQLRKALAKVSPATRLLIRVLHGINARHYGFGGGLPEQFDLIGYLDALLEVRYHRPKSNAVRQQIIMETAFIWRALGFDCDPGCASDLTEYLKIVCAVLDARFDLQQLARDVCSFFSELPE
ncbi:hypothetical protein [Thiohalocapsa sp.]|uniref:hypothetical protein n=1 Tax=Thiohalocapsa sp. TaxID=2497641 RepID=UPI0025FD5C8A|nr:hypothetical protein [Thiohalocapsa sp.]